MHDLILAPVDVWYDVRRKLGHAMGGLSDTNVNDLIMLFCFHIMNKHFFQLQIGIFEIFFNDGAVLGHIVSVLLKGVICLRKQA